jgi:amino acid transporter
MTTSSNQELFSRQSSGLIRLASPFRTYAFNLGFAGVTYTSFIFVLFPATYPQSNLFLALVIALIGFIALALVYAMLSAAMPRSGGDYVYVSRTLHPVVGFAANFASAMAYIFFIAQGAFLMSQFIFSTLFSTLGSTLGNATLRSIGEALAGPTLSFVVGTLIILGFAVLVAIGMETYYRFQAISFVIGVVGITAMIVVLLINSQSDFIAAFNGYAQNTAGLANGYQSILDSARASGYETGGFSWAHTLGITGIALLTGMGTAFIGGEVKEVKKSQLVGMVGGTATVGLFVMLIAILLWKSVGLEFNGAASYLWVNAPDKYPLPIAPVFTTWASIISTNVFLLLVVMAAFLVWSYFFLPQNIIVVSRMMLAWSLDRLVPAKLGQVSSRRFTPVIAITVVTILAEVWLAIYAFSPYFNALAAIIPVSLAFLVVSITGVVFPYRSKTREIYEKSGIKYTLAGVPLLTLAAIVSSLYWLIALYYEFTHPELGYNNPISLGFTAITLVVPVTIYLFVRWTAARQGLDLNKAFEEIPPE